MWSRIAFYFSLLLSVTSVIVIEQEENAIVQIAQGLVIGSRAMDGEYYEFHGIPYADSTSGINRFKAPNPPPSFADIFGADRKNIKCIRSLGVGYEGTEDCLVANVYTPAIPTDNIKPMPVMVWIKGKEFDKVYEYDLSFRNFMEQGVVVVSLNFRESILGFLCLGTETAPGNAGLKDIIAGLKWVQENVAHFGGDPNSITLFGHGSGAAAVDLVSLSPLANGLVHKIISQSGTASAPWAVTRNNVKYALTVAQALGHDVETIEELSEIYTKTSVAALMAVINELDLTDNSLAFAPCIEKDSLGTEKPFMIQTPQETISKGEFLQVPFMTGFVDHEGTIRSEEALEDDWLEKMQTSFTDFLQPDLEFEDKNTGSIIANEIKSFYFNNNEIDIEDYIEYHGDTMILISTLKEVQSRASHSNQPLFLYQFSYKGLLGELFVGPLEVSSAAHSEELAYMFYENSENVNLKDLTVSDIILERWTNFAKTGNPTSSISQIQWHPYTTEEANYLRIIDDDEYNGAVLDIELTNPHKEKMDFWNRIYTDFFLDARSYWELPNTDEETGITDSPGTDATVTDPGDTDPVVTDTPVTDLPVTDPPVTDLPVTEPAVTDPGVTDNPSPGSASSIGAYTFTVLSFFTLVHYYQCSFY